MAITALFIGAHQDDESLIMGGGILNLLATPVNNVFYSCITDGSASGINNPAVTGLTSSQFVAARNKEKDNSLSRLGLPAGHQLYAAGGMMKDGTLNSDPLLNYISANGPLNSGYNGNDINPQHVNMALVAQIKDLLQQVTNITGVERNAISVKCHCYMDPQQDHRAISQAVLYLLDLGEITDVRQYVSPLIWKTGVTDANGAYFAAMSTFRTSQEIPINSAAYTNALLEFVIRDGVTKLGGFWGYATYGIGYKSVWKIFTDIMEAKYSYYCHPPVCTKN